VDSITKVALAIVGVAMVATLVVNYKGTAAVITAGTQGFANSITAAQKG
jgi:hypothetical protein